jgi:hypothetical protein
VSWMFSEAKQIRIEEVRNSKSTTTRRRNVRLVGDDLRLATREHARLRRDAPSTVPSHAATRQARSRSDAKRLRFTSTRLWTITSTGLPHAAHDVLSRRQ